MPLLAPPRRSSTSLVRPKSSEVGKVIEVRTWEKFFAGIAGTYLLLGPLIMVLKCPLCSQPGRVEVSRISSHPLSLRGSISCSGCRVNIQIHDGRVYED